MAYIYKKQIYGKPYYYLRVSKKAANGRPITRDIAYLGTDVAKIWQKLDKLPARYKEEIRKGYENIRRFIDTNRYREKVQKLKLKKNKYMDKELLEQIGAMQLHFHDHFLKLPEQTKEEVYHNFLIDFAFNTTSMEGNTITLREAAALLKEEITPRNRTLREVYDLQNTEKVFLWLLQKKPKFSQELIMQVHDRLLDKIDTRKGYRFEDIRVFRSRFKTSPGRFVKADMTILFDWYSKYNKKLHPFVLASLFHQKFERVHPFADGNGRTGRIILNYVLLLHNYPPLIIPKKTRNEYLQALSEVDKWGIGETDPKYFKNLIRYLGNNWEDFYWSNFNV